MLVSPLQPNRASLSLPLSTRASAAQVARPAKPAESKSWEQLGVTLSFKRGKEVFGQGDPSEHFYKVVGGAVRACRLLPDGRRHVVDFFVGGDFFGLGSAASFQFSAEAITNAVVLRYARRDLDALLDSRPALARELLQAMCAALTAAQDQLLLLGRKTAQERIASFLLRMAEKCRQPGGGNRLDLLMGRADIADHLGLTIETVSRVLSRLKQDGILALPSPSRVVFLKPEALEEIQTGWGAE